MLIIIFKILCDLLPDGHEAVLLLGIVRLTGYQPGGIRTTSVVVDIQDAVHALADHIVNHLMHALHPCFLDLGTDGIVRTVPRRQCLCAANIFHTVEGSLHVWIPGHRQTDGIESGILHHLDQFGCGDDLPPSRLIIRWCPTGKTLNPHIIDISRIAVECITQVPAHTHIFDSIGGSLKIRTFAADTHQQYADE